MLEWRSSRGVNNAYNRLFCDRVNEPSHSNFQRFENCVVLKRPIDVNLPDGKKLRETKVGKIMRLKIIIIRKRLNYKMLYYVKGLQRNLFSLSKITRNCMIVVRDSSAKNL